MDEPEQLIDPAIVNSSVERMNNMQAVERQRLALDLLRFMALLFAEALRMMSLANLAEQPAGDSSGRHLGTRPGKSTRFTEKGRELLSAMAGMKG